MLKTQIVDLFAGPGGLGEGFSAFTIKGRKPFSIAVSAEKEKFAHSTLRLRAYWRLLKKHKKSTKHLLSYYKGIVDIPWSSGTSDLWEQAEKEALLLELGKHPDNQILFDAIRSRVTKDRHWVLIGGPPCQAYSIANRAHSIEKGKSDERHFLYKEYLNVIKEFRPSVFVMENVRGLLSCQLDQNRIIHRILQDLSSPGQSSQDFPVYQYAIHSLVDDTCFTPDMDVNKINLKKFVVPCELYGIPQARHRVILIGIRDDIKNKLPKLTESPPVTVWDAIGDMPPVRSGISRQNDSLESWRNGVTSEYYNLAQYAVAANRSALADELLGARDKILKCDLLRGGRYVQGKYPSNLSEVTQLQKWLRDKTIDGWLNHETRTHMLSDLRRYGFITTFANLENKNPVGAKAFDLEGLAPNHVNWQSGHFCDRFKAQLKNRPASTITSHISKDGHAFIHPDPAQCRSLTVREAARLQTFPDNYFFEGPRTAQYIQVGNAVPPLLAKQIAQCVWKLLQE